MTRMTIGMEQVKVARTGTVYVASRSRKGLWHTVKDGRCDCQGFRHRGTCRHIELAVGLQGEQPAAKGTCRTCGRAWDVAALDHGACPICYLFPTAGA
jgi:hypothetical protein